jgi:tripartite-type tricarboxylate transporter receptor subunit TctC
VQRLNAAVLEAARTPAVTQRFGELGFDYVGSTPAEGDARLAREAVKWRDVIRRGNIRADS